MPKLTVPQIYSEGTRAIDRLLQRFQLDGRVSELDRKRAREAAAVLIGIMVNAQAKEVKRTGNA